MKNYLIVSILFVAFLAGCKEKKQGSNSQKDQPISALSIIKGQLNSLDTSLYEIIKYESDSTKTDSAFLKREEVRKIAEPFLSLPEIADRTYYDKYTEDKLIDAEQNTLSITSISKIDTAEIQKQIIIVSLSPTSNSKIESIFIDRYLPKGDSTIEQKLFWVVDKYFSIHNIIEKEGQPDETHSTKVTWQ